MGSSFSHHIIPPRWTIEHFRCSFMPTSIRDHRLASLWPARYAVLPKTHTTHIQSVGHTWNPHITLSPLSLCGLIYLLCCIFVKSFLYYSLLFLAYCTICYITLHTYYTITCCMCYCYFAVLYDVMLYYYIAPYSICYIPLLYYIYILYYIMWIYYSVLLHYVLYHYDIAILTQTSTIT